MPIWETIASTVFREAARLVGDKFSRRRALPSGAEIETIALDASAAYVPRTNGVVAIVGLKNTETKRDKVLSALLRIEDFTLNPAFPPRMQVETVPWAYPATFFVDANDYVRAAIYFKGDKRLVEAMKLAPVPGNVVINTLNSGQLSQQVSIPALGGVMRKLVRR